MTGVRRPDGTPLNDYAPGDYGQWRNRWYAMTPAGTVGNLGAHDVVEHDDGTITVSPSILVDGGDGPGWHGYLEAGVWRTA